MRNLFFVLNVCLLTFIPGCISTDGATKVVDAAKGVSDATSSVLGFVKNVLTFPIDIFTPAPPPPEPGNPLTDKEVLVPAGSGLGGLIAGLVGGWLAGRRKAKS